MKFLQEHCELAWVSAVTNFYKITHGLVDIEQQKVFISFFHNAVELCFKQIMIDEGNHNVIKYKKWNPMMLKYI